LPRKEEEPWLCLLSPHFPERKKKVTVVVHKVHTYFEEERKEKSPQSQIPLITPSQINLGRYRRKGRQHKMRVLLQIQIWNSVE
jgi:hypothetical protein